MSVYIGTNTNALIEEFQSDAEGSFIAPVGVGKVPDIPGYPIDITHNTYGSDIIRLANTGAPDIVYLEAIDSNAYEDDIGSEDYFLSIYGFDPSPKQDRVVFAESLTKFGGNYGFLGYIYDGIGIGATEQDLNSDGIKDTVIGYHTFDRVDKRIVFYSVTPDQLGFIISSAKDPSIKTFPKGDYNASTWDDFSGNSTVRDDFIELYARDINQDQAPSSSAQTSTDLLTGVVTKEPADLPATFETSDSFDVAGVIEKKKKNGKTKKKSITRSVDAGFLVGTETIDGFVSRFSVYADFDRSGTFNKRRDTLIGSGVVASQHLGLYESLPVGSRSWGLEFGGAFAITYANEVVATGTHFL